MGSGVNIEHAFDVRCDNRLGGRLEVLSDVPHKFLFGGSSATVWDGRWRDMIWKEGVDVMDEYWEQLSVPRVAAD